MTDDYGDALEGAGEGKIPPEGSPLRMHPEFLKHLPVTQLYPWVAWKEGRDWTAWHLDDEVGTGRTLCGRIPKGAISHRHEKPEPTDTCRACLDAADREESKQPCAWCGTLLYEWDPDSRVPLCDPPRTCSAEYKFAD